MKCKISDAAGYVQEMYSKCHMSLTLEMCRTHEISDTYHWKCKGNFMCPSLELYMKCEIFDITGNVQEMSCFLVSEMYMKCEISIS